MVRAPCWRQLRADPSLEPDRHGRPPPAPPKGLDPKQLALAPGDRIEIEAPPADLAPRMAVPVTIRRASGATEVFEAVAAIETSLEVDLLRTGGIIPFILRRAIARSAGPRSGSLEIEARTAIHEDRRRSLRIFTFNQ